MPPKQRDAYATPGGVRQCESTGKWRFNYKQVVPKHKKKEGRTSAYEHDDEPAAVNAREAHKAAWLAGHGGLRAMEA